MNTKLLTLLNSHPLRKLSSQTRFTCFTFNQENRRGYSTVSLASGSCFTKRDFQKQRKGLSDTSHYGLNSKRYFKLSPAGIVNASPAAIQPYLRLMRLDKPIGELIEAHTHLNTLCLRKSRHYLKNNICVSLTVLWGLC